MKSKPSSLRTGVEKHMTQYKKLVEKQRIKLEAEEWGAMVKDLHVHSFDSMWYDNRPQDTENNQMVTDIQYNNGMITRKLSDGTLIILREAWDREKVEDLYGRTTN